MINIKLQGVQIVSDNEAVINIKGAEKHKITIDGMCAFATKEKDKEKVLIYLEYSRSNNWIKRIKKSLIDLLL